MSMLYTSDQYPLLSAEAQTAIFSPIPQLIAPHADIHVFVSGFNHAQPVALVCPPHVTFTHHTISDKPRYLRAPRSSLNFHHYRPGELANYYTYISTNAKPAFTVAYVDSNEAMSRLRLFSPAIIIAPASVKVAPPSTTYDTVIFKGGHTHFTTNVTQLTLNKALSSGLTSSPSTTDDLVVYYATPTAKGLTYTLSPKDVIPLSYPSVISAIPGTFYLPNLTGIHIPSCAIKPITITPKLTATSSGITQAFMAHDQSSLRAYSELEGKNSPILDALISKNNLLSKPLDEVVARTEQLGYTLQLSPSVKAKLAHKVKYFSKQLLPLQPVTNTELLAYFNPGPIVAKATLIHPKTHSVIWMKGHTYYLTPSWTRQSITTTPEPVFDTNGQPIDSQWYVVKHSVLSLIITSESASVTIPENQIRATWEEELQKVRDNPSSTPKQILEASTWVPLLDEFLQCFDLPKVQLAKEVHAEEYLRYKQELTTIAPHLKPYQSDCVANNALKTSGILASRMGAGKTLQALALIRLKKKRFNLLIVPPSLVSSWIKEARRLNFNVRRLDTHAKVSALQRHYRSTLHLTPAQKQAKMYEEQEVYITTPEFLSLGDISNTVYTPWSATLQRNASHAVITRDPAWTSKDLPLTRTWRESLVVTTASNSTHPTLNRLNLTGPLPANTSYKLAHCPNCNASPKKGWSPRGYCSATHIDTYGRSVPCGYRAYAYLSKNKAMLFEPQVTRTISSSGTTEHTSYALPPISVHSDYSFPAYRRIGKIFGLKIVDECHQIANIKTLRGSAVLAIKTDSTFVLSGTLSRGYISDIETALMHVFPANTPLFPFSRNSKDFQTQFSTTRQRFFSSAATKTSASYVPEASNVNRLRKMLNCGMTTIASSILDAEWALPTLKRTYHPVTLNPENLEAYNKALGNVSAWATTVTTAERNKGALSQLWSLRSICDGIEKLAVIETYVKKWIRERRKFIIVAPTQQYYKVIRDLLDSYSINYIAVDQTTAPDKREAVTAAFASASVQAVVSRTRLISTGLNTLIHADRLLIASGEYDPATLNQMERRICRPGQKSKDLEVVYPIVRIKGCQSAEEQMLRLVHKKQIAIDQVLEGTTRWIAPSLLIESALESKGAAKVLSSLITSNDEDQDLLDKLFGAPAVQDLDISIPIEPDSTISQVQDPFTNFIDASIPDSFN